MKSIMKLNMKYNLGCITTNESTNEFEHKGTIAPYWYPYISEQSYWESVCKDITKDIKFKWPIS